MDINHISVSRASTFHECAQKYKFKYHLKVESPEPEKFHFTYGKVVHKIAEEYVNRGNEADFLEVAQSVLSGKIEIEPGKVSPPFRNFPPEYVDKMPGNLRNLKRFTSEIGVKTEGYTEYPFNYDLCPPDECCVVGFIDRIVILKGKYFIFDYKTTKKGKFRKNKETVKKDIQLRMYAKVVQRDFGAKAEDIHCALLYVDGDNGSVIGARYSQEDIDEAEDYLRKTYLAIRDANPATVVGTPSDFGCRFCEYNSLCQFAKK